MGIVGSSRWTLGRLAPSGDGSAEAAEPGDAEPDAVSTVLGVGVDERPREDEAGHANKPAKERKRSKPIDAVAAGAIEEARIAVEQVAPDGAVGEYLGAEKVDDRVVSHRFVCTSRGYRGWVWTVVMSRAVRARVATVSEVVLAAGDNALTAPEWVPWADRLRPGDVGPAETLARIPYDSRLNFGFEETDDKDVDQLALWELGLGRVRVLNAEGRAQAAHRWTRGEFSANNAGRSQPCHSCGFWVQMPGAFQGVVGVCANEWSVADGRVVAREYGCGAHSESDAPKSVQPLPDHVLDESGYDQIDLL